jgi:hypothetical protein
MIQNRCQLEELIGAQRFDVYHIDIGSAIFQLLLTLDKIRVQLFDRRITEGLANSRNKCLECERETWLDLFHSSGIFQGDKLIAS